MRKILVEFLKSRNRKRRIEEVARLVRLEAERPQTDRQVRKYLLALADVIEKA